MRHASAGKSRVSIVSGNVIFAKLPAILSAREQRETEKTFVYVFNSRNRIVTEGWKELSDWIVYNTVTNLCDCDESNRFRNTHPNMCPVCFRVTLRGLGIIIYLSTCLSNTEHLRLCEASRSFIVGIYENAWC